METAADAGGRARCANRAFCVKTVDTETAARLAPHLDAGSRRREHLVERRGQCRVGVCEACGIDALGAAVYVAAEMPAPGVVKHSGRGDLIVGRFPGSSARTEIVEACFARAEITCGWREDIRAPLWAKMFSRLRLQCDLGIREGALRWSWARARTSGRSRAWSWKRRRP